MPPPQPTPVGLDSSHPLLSSFPAFLLVAIHNLLFYRNLYPPATFLSTRAYNLPVHQSRHPAVCAWVRSAVDALSAQLARGAVARVAFVVHSPLHATRWASPSPSRALPPPGSVLERWVFDTTSFPSWPAMERVPDPAKAMDLFGRMLAKEAREEEARERHGMALFPESGRLPGAGEEKVSWPDVDEQLRGALRRMAGVAEGMEKLPEGCTFTVAVELREQGRAPIGHPQDWIPSEPNLQPKSKAKEVAREDLGGVKTTPIRSVQAGPMFFECWVEEGKAKGAPMASEQDGEFGSSGLVFSSQSL